MKLFLASFPSLNEFYIDGFLKLLELKFP